MRGIHLIGIITCVAIWYHQSDHAFWQDRHQMAATASTIPPDMCQSIPTNSCNEYAPITVEKFLAPISNCGEWFSCANSRSKCPSWPEMHSKLTKHASLFMAKKKFSLAARRRRTCPSGCRHRRRHRSKPLRSRNLPVESRPGPPHSSNSSNRPTRIRLVRKI